MKEIGKKLALAVSGQPLPVSIVDDQTGEKLDFKIYQPTFEILIECSGILSEIGIKDIQNIFDGRNIFEFISNHGDKVLKILAINLDRKIDYSEKTYEFLKKNLTPHECFDLLSNIILRTGTQDFQKSIIEMTAMSLFNQREIIALSTRLSS